MAISGEVGCGLLPRGIWIEASGGRVIDLLSLRNMCFGGVVEFGDLEVVVVLECDGERSGSISSD